MIVGCSYNNTSTFNNSYGLLVEVNDENGEKIENVGFLIQGSNIENFSINTNNNRVTTVSNLRVTIIPVKDGRKFESDIKIVTEANSGDRIGFTLLKLEIPSPYENVNWSTYGQAPYLNFNIFLNLSFVICFLNILLKYF